MAEARAGARLAVVGIAAACVAIAALSLLVPSAPTYDPWAWLVWGRELVHGGLDTTGGPSWKPLPVLITAPLSVFGAAAPALWLVVVRAAAVAALVLAARIAARLAGSWVAGAIAAGGLLLTTDWVRYAGYGTSEPLSAALVLGAVDRHLAGSRRGALVLGFMAALCRPEVWPFLGLYAVWLARREPRTRALAVALLAAIPILWFGADWLGSGALFSGGTKARTPVHLTTAGVINRDLGVVTLPVLVLAAVAVALAVRRGRRDLALLGGGGAALFCIVVVMMRLGYGGNERFIVPAAAIACVLAGVGVVWLVSLPARPLLSVGVAVVLAAVALPSTLSRAGQLEPQVRATTARARYQRDLDRLVGAVGPARVLACGRPDVNWLAQTELAWRLGVPLRQVQQAWNGAGPRIPFRAPALVFRASRSRFAPGAPPRLPRQMRVRPLRALGRWSVASVTAPARSPAACLPGHSA